MPVLPRCPSASCYLPSHEGADVPRDPQWDVIATEKLVSSSMERKEASPRPRSMRACFIFNCPLQRKHLELARLIPPRPHAKSSYYVGGTLWSWMVMN